MSMGNSDHTLVKQDGHYNHIQDRSVSKLKEPFEENMSLRGRKNLSSNMPSEIIWINPLPSKLQSSHLQNEISNSLLAEYRKA